MLERSDVDMPLWRKKVDKTLLKDSETPIPKWLWEVWDIPNTFGGVRSKREPQSIVDISYQGKEYSGHITKVKSPGGYKFRFTFEKSLSEALNDTYLMSYMRMLEAEINPEKNYRQVEDEISFWEFLDIEFNSEQKHFIFTSHFTVKPTFPNLFSRLIKSAPLKAMESEILGKDAQRIHKQNWKPRAEYKTELGAINVVYMLLDSKSKLLYVGEAENLKNRFDAGHPDIREWDFYKYNVLPNKLYPYRLAIERMVIRDMAALLTNKQDIPNIKISEYKLANRKIDK
ncbi:hypothetical protein L3Q72_05260 [Vibrio sp. JC009]|uniref:hypothetical protein n=1 Tax=Vibrio sp. JC009 TaxID=2912314 RepID=UPI0023B0983B|nr:hypothetical protein [Vibrio sp. JC009]WED22801.1 hypothetical protein L3Q72_05260 [Vibrio sp. JC009]